MNLNITKNKYLNALLALMILSATIHLLVLCFIALITGNFFPLNYISILSLDYFFPAVSNTLASNLLATGVAALLYAVILLYSQK